MGKSKSGKSKKPQRVPTKSEDKQAVDDGRLTIRQSRMAKIISEQTAKTAGEAAILAGYSPKTARQGGHQAIERIKKRAPDILDAIGLTLHAVIDKSLRPLLTATETRVFQHEGEVTDYVELADNGTRLRATNMALELHGAYPTEQEKQQGSLGVEVIVVDIARPDRSGTGVKVTASTAPPRPHKPEPEEDPRPRD
jgi:phage terminase small subunit